MGVTARGVRAPSFQRKLRDGAMVSAIDLVRENGWGIGTRLTHPKWKNPRRICNISGDEVQLSGPNGSYSWVFKLPAKVEECDGDD